MGKTYDEMTPSEQARLTWFLREFYRARPDITARLVWILRFLQGWDEFNRRFPSSALTRDEFLGMVVTAGLREWYPPPTASTFTLGRQTDRVVHLGLKSLKEHSGTSEIDPIHSELIQTMCKDIQGYEFLTRIGAIGPKILGRIRPRKSIPISV